jgi:hypothetical protein
MMGWDWRLGNCGLYEPTVHPRVMAMWTMVWWYRLGIAPIFSTRALWQPSVLSGGPVTREISGASRTIDEGNENFVYPSQWDFKRSLICRKILQHGTSGFTSHPKEGVLRIFIALKNPSPWPGSKPRPSGPLASTLTSTPPRRQWFAVQIGIMSLNKINHLIPVMQHSCRVFEVRTEFLCYMDELRLQRVKMLCDGIAVSWIQLPVCMVEADRTLIGRPIIN